MTIVIKILHRMVIFLITNLSRPTVYPNNVRILQNNSCINVTYINRVVSTFECSLFMYNLSFYMSLESRRLTKVSVYPVTWIEVAFVDFLMLNNPCMSWKSINLAIIFFFKCIVGLSVLMFYMGFFYLCYLIRFAYNFTLLYYFI